MFIPILTNNAIYASVRRRSKGTICAIDSYDPYRVTLQEYLNSLDRFNPEVSITCST